MPDITYVTTCKGRLHHLKQTLPRVVNQPGIAVIVVDYNCPDGTEKWVKETYPPQTHPHVRVVKVTDEEGFNFSRARNIGGHAAETEWVAFFDADILVDPNFFAIVRKDLKPGHIHIAKNTDGNTWGSVILEKSYFLKSEGYDEVVAQWGGVDVAFLNVLFFIGIQREYFRGDLVSAIPHNDGDRVRFSTNKNVEFAKCVSSVYESCRVDIMRIQNRLLTFEERKVLRASVENAISKMLTDGATGAEIRIAMPTTKYRRAHGGITGITRRLVFTLERGAIDQALASKPQIGE